MCISRGWGGRGRMPCWEIWNISEGTHSEDCLGLSQCSQMCWWTNSLCPVMLLDLPYLGDSQAGSGFPCGSKMAISDLYFHYEGSLPSLPLTHKSWHLLTQHLGRTARDSQVRLGKKFCLCFSKRWGVT